MKRALRQRLAAVVATLPDDDQERQAALAVWASDVLLQRGAVGEACDLLLAAAEDVHEADARHVVAEALLRLGRAAEQRGQCDIAEPSLRRAADLDSVLATPALAQHLQRAQRSDEAIEQWMAALRLGAADTAAYLNLGRLLERKGQYEQSLATYLRLIEALPSARNYLTVAQRLDALGERLPAPEPSMTIRIALEGNATLEHLKSYLLVECFRAGLRPQFYIGGFDQYSQEILNPASSLYAFAPEVLILAVHASRLFPRLHGYPFDLTPEERRAEAGAGIATLENLITVFRERCPALTLVNNMVAPQRPALGTLDLRDDLGQAALVAEINLRLAHAARDRFQNVYVVDEDRVQARAGKANATDARHWFTARLGWSESVLPLLAQEYLRFLKPFKGLARKCLVLDLDNTLWGGVVGEDGIEGIALGAEAPGNAFVAFQQELYKLWRRGVLLALCSKNNLDDAMAVLDRHPAMVLRRAHFAAQRINWESKTANIRSIAQELNIGLDSVVFLDDSPVERAAVRAELPQVDVPELPTDPAYYRRALLDLDVFESLSLTEEDRKRNQLYAEQRGRAELQQRHAGGSLEGYLADLQITVDIAPLDDASLPRIAQLTNKTNQFNVTTRRYSEAQLCRMRDQGYRIYGMRVTDRFGDNGLTGVAILAPPVDDAVEIDTLLLSCRVMGRGVETALLAFLGEEARRLGLTALRGRFIPTPKNAPAADVYAKNGFNRIRRDGTGDERWRLDIGVTPIEAPRWLTVRTPVAGTERHPERAIA